MSAVIVNPSPVVYRTECTPGGGVIGHTTMAPPVVTPPTTPDGKRFPWDDVRLPDSLEPFSYNLLMHPNLTTREVKGKWMTDSTCLPSVENYFIRVSL